MIVSMPRLVIKYNTCRPTEFFFGGFGLTSDSNYFAPLTGSNMDMFCALEIQILIADVWSNRLHVCQTKTF